MILKLTNGEYIHAESYGSNSWGTGSQDSIEKKDGEWHIESHICVDSREDVWETITTPLDVVEELNGLPDGATVINRDDLELFYCLVFNIRVSSGIDIPNMSDREIIKALEEQV